MKQEAQQSKENQSQNSNSVNSFDQYKSAFNSMKKYVNIYGGTKSILFSPYFLISILITAACRSMYFKPGWWELPKMILPSMIGFSIASFSLWISMLSSGLQKIFSRTPRTIQVASSINSTFFHFIFIQILALIFAIAAESYPIATFAKFHPNIIPIWIKPYLYIQWHNITVAFYFISFWLFIYALTLCMASIIALFEIAQIWQGFSLRQLTIHQSTKKTATCGKISLRYKRKTIY